MKRIAFASLFSIIVLGLAVQQTTRAVDSGPSANGGFRFRLEDGETRFLEFNAHLHGDVADGGMKFTDPSAVLGGENGSQTTGVQITAQFDCMKVEGNRAVMGGVISSSNIAEAIGHRVLLVVEDNGEGIPSAAPDRLTWGVYGLPATGWTPKDSERDEDNGASLSWIATDFERTDDVGIPSNRSAVVRCDSFPVASYSFVDIGHGNGNLQVKP
jgi:hypothetical protein